MRLTRGEAWWLQRRRLAQTQAEMSTRCGVSEETYRRWERDAVRPNIEPLGLGGPLSFGEYSALARRRKGWSVADMARRCRISRQTLIKREADRTRTALDLARWWDKRYPEPAGPAPIVLQRPVRIWA